MSGRPALDAVERTIIGKKVKRLRREGKVPGVIYGTLVEEPIPVTLDTRELYRTYIDYGSFSLIDITVNGDTHTVYIRTIQQHPITREPIHTELFAPNLTQKMVAAVPVITYGESPNIDGAVTHLRDNVELEGLPTDLPGAIEIDVSGLVEIDDTIWVRDLPIPDNVELITDPDEPLVRLIEVRVVVEEPEEDEELEAALAEGEEPEGEEAAEGEAEPEGEDESEE